MALVPEDRIEIDRLIPHRGESLLLDAVVDHDEGSTVARVIVGDPSMLLRDDGTVPPWLVVEYMAQTVAVHEGFIARSEGRSLELGFLVTVVGLELQPVTLYAGETLDIHARRTRGRPGLGIVSHHCAVHRGAEADSREVIAEGRLSIAIKGLRLGGLSGSDHASAKRRHDGGG